MAVRNSRNATSDHGSGKLAANRPAEAAVGHLDVYPVDEQRRHAELPHRAERIGAEQPRAAPPRGSTAAMPATMTPTRMKKNDGARAPEVGRPEQRRAVRRRAASDPQRDAAGAEPRDQPALGRGVARAIEQHADRGAGEHEAGPRKERERGAAGERPEVALERRRAARRARPRRGCPAWRRRRPTPRRSTPAMRQRGVRARPQITAAPAIAGPITLRMSTLSVLPRTMSSTRSWPSDVRPPSTSDWTRNRIASTQIQPPRLTIGQAACHGRCVAAPEPAAQRERDRHAGRGRGRSAPRSRRSACSTRTRR